jgi:hypothetical protein
MLEQCSKREQSLGQHCCEELGNQEFRAHTRQTVTSMREVGQEDHFVIYLGVRLNTSEMDGRI